MSAPTMERHPQVRAPGQFDLIDAWNGMKQKIGELPKTVRYTGAVILGAAVTAAGVFGAVEIAGPAAGAIKKSDNAEFIADKCGDGALTTRGLLADWRGHSTRNRHNIVRSGAANRFYHVSEVDETLDQKVNQEFAVATLAHTATVDNFGCGYGPKEGRIIAVGDKTLTAGSKEFVNTNSLNARYPNGWSLKRTVNSTMHIARVRLEAQANCDNPIRGTGEVFVWTPNHGHSTPVPTPRPQPKPQPRPQPKPQPQPQHLPVFVTKYVKDVGGNVFPTPTDRTFHFDWEKKETNGSTIEMGTVDYTSTPLYLGECVVGQEFVDVNELTPTGPEQWKPLTDTHEEQACADPDGNGRVDFVFGDQELPPPQETTTPPTTSTRPPKTTTVTTTKTTTVTTTTTPVKPPPPPPPSG